ncbi:hypothetical protein ACIBG7_41010 [Nonomuraea sp. NPDC050328]|uniref:hypothetical protein n=1 Tax=Nonomuraea sp. NPDC050328 TaxID=3364361 RepID=UPI00379CFDF0
MTGKWEDDLRDALVHAAEAAPRAPRELPALVASRSRRRRARRQALLAAAMVAVIAGGVAVAVRESAGPAVEHAVQPARPEESRSATDETSRSVPRRPVITAADPVGEVWPGAVWKIPAKLPGGQKLRPLLFLDDRTLLAQTWESFEKADAIHAYDLETGDSRKIADIRTPKGVHASEFAVGSGRIVWQTIKVAGRRGTSEFWSVPVTGGTPEAIATGRPVKGRGDALAVVGDRLVFSLLEGGVHTVPLAGGEVSAVAGAEGHHLLSWPWVGTPGEYTPDNEPSFAKLRNAETGETSEAVVHPGEKFVRCGVLTCTGVRPDQTPFQRRRDGSGERVLPEEAPHGLAADRFMTVHLPKGGQVLHDLVTGRSGDLGLRPDKLGRSVSVQPALGDGRLVQYPLGKELVVIDLARIE